MKVRASNVAWLLPFFLSACFFHKAHQQQVQQLAPPVAAADKPAPTHPELPTSATTIPSEPLVSDAGAIVEEPVKPPVRHRRPVSKTTQEAADSVPPTSGATQQASTGSPGVSAIGQLTSGDLSDLRRETMDSIAATERGLNGLGRSLSGQEQKTATQIRDFLKKAKEALKSGDVDGAYTLAAKAKVLLSELSR
jgi:hypothetical protein